MQTAEGAEYVAEEFRPVRHDLLAAGLHGAAGDPYRMPGDSRLLATVSIDGDEIGIVAFDREAPAAERLRTLADFTQDLLLENFVPDGRSVVWPRCQDRTHGHPMVAGIDAGQAVWSCPRDPDLAVPIGELEA